MKTYSRVGSMISTNEGRGEHARKNRVCSTPSFGRLLAGPDNEIKEIATSHKSGTESQSRELEKSVQTELQRLNDIRDANEAISKVHQLLGNKKSQRLTNCMKKIFNIQVLILNELCEGDKANRMLLEEEFDIRLAKLVKYKTLFKKIRKENDSKELKSILKSQNFKLIEPFRWIQNADDLLKTTKSLLNQVPIKVAVAVEFTREDMDNRSFVILLLFDDVLVCAALKPSYLRKSLSKIYKQKCSSTKTDARSENRNSTAIDFLKNIGSSSHSYNLSWFMPLEEITFLEIQDWNDQVIEQRLSQLEDLQTKVNKTKKKILEDAADKVTSSYIGKKNRNELSTLQTALSLASPNIPILVKTSTEKPRGILFNSEKERIEWIEAIKTQQISSKAKNKSGGGEIFTEKVVKKMLPQNKNIIPLNQLEAITSLGSDKNGFLYVTIKDVKGLNEKEHYFVSIEVDSNAQFRTVEYTDVHSGSSDTNWNQSFIIELEHAQTVFFNVHRINEIIGQLELKLNSAFSKGRCQIDARSITSRKVPSSQIKLSLVMTYSEKKMGQNITFHNYRVFGKSLKHILKYDRKLAKKRFKAVRDTLKPSEESSIEKKLPAPILVIYSTRQIERKAYNSLGIYRVCGNAATMDRLKKYFNINGVEKAIRQLSEYNIFTVGSILKVFFSDLKEPLIDACTLNKLVHAIEISGTQECGKEFSKILRNMPSANVSTLMYLLDHFVRMNDLAEFTKMPIDNLALVWVNHIFHENNLLDGTGTLNNTNRVDVNFAAKSLSIQINVLKQLIHAKATASLKP